MPALEEWADVRVLAFGRLELRGHRTDVRRELRLTPEHWDDIEGVIFGGDTRSAARLIRLAWDRARPDQIYLNYDFEYGIEPSSSPIRLPDPGSG